MGASPQQHRGIGSLTDEPHTRKHSRGHCATGILQCKRCNKASVREQRELATAPRPGGPGIRNQLGASRRRFITPMRTDAVRRVSTLGGDTHFRVSYCLQRDRRGLGLERMLSPVPRSAMRQAEDWTCGIAWTRETLSMLRRTPGCTELAVAIHPSWVQDARAQSHQTITNKTCEERRLRCSVFHIGSLLPS